MFTLRTDGNLTGTKTRRTMTIPPENPNSPYPENQGQQPYPAYQGQQGYAGQQGDTGYPGQQDYPGQQAYPGQQPDFTSAAPPGPGEPFDGAASAENLRRPLYGCGFGTAIKRFFKNYVNFTGRASRCEYWWAYLFNGIIGLIGSIIWMIGYIPAISWVVAHTSRAASAMESGSPYDTGLSITQAPTFAIAMIGMILLGLYGLATLIPNWALSWRRLHDANFAGPFALLTLVPYVGWIPVLILTIMPSKPQGRRFDR